MLSSTETHQLICRLLNREIPEDIGAIGARRAECWCRDHASREQLERLSALAVFDDATEEQIIDAAFPGIPDDERAKVALDLFFLGNPVVKKSFPRSRYVAESWAEFLRGWIIGVAESWDSVRGPVESGGRFA